MSSIPQPASAGARFRQALKDESPLQVIGAINANHALLAKRAGYRAIYLSGGGVAAGSLGLPDLGINTLDDVLTDVRRITDVCDVPLLVDVDTGFGGAFNIARTVKSLTKFGAAAISRNTLEFFAACNNLPAYDPASVGAVLQQAGAMILANPASLTDFGGNLGGLAAALTPNPGQPLSDAVPLDTGSVFFESVQSTGMAGSGSSGLPPLNRTFLRICGSGSKRWSTSLAGAPARTSSASTCSAATSPSPVVA